MLKLNLLRHLVPGMIGVVGQIFLIAGGWMLISQGWDRASGRRRSWCSAGRAGRRR